VFASTLSKALSIEHFCFKLEVFADFHDKKFAEITGPLHKYGIAGLKWANCFYFDEIVSQFAIGASCIRLMPFDSVFSFTV